ncbi:hypothetical protein [Natrinema versiforme]|uniref:Uncharacterized protein n=1 Tax=Natrinema versiforme JCM 10478 TaxID=1227496 RepID=L9XNZ5_9EURY|nr:hypothetical protein [Natrinema versiforme]ELY63499.1 hypothetical protein C489_18846 [Natrinema versiforme JCM 10478]
MTNDDSRGLESPDRHASTETDLDTDAVRDRLEAITDLTETLLEEVRRTGETLDDGTRRDATRRLREIDAEARRVGLELCDRPLAENPATLVGCDSLTTTYSGPAPGAIDAAGSKRADNQPTGDCNRGDRDGE